MQRILTKTMGNVEGSQFSVASDSPFLIEALIKLYSDSLGAVIRELTSNAKDATVEKLENLKNQGVDITILDSFITKSIIYVGDSELVFQDFGNGMSPEFMLGDKGYKLIGFSTKTDSDTQIGSFGLGRLSALSICDSYIVETVWENIKSVYLVLKNNGVSIELLNKTPLTQEEIEQGVCGTKIIINHDYVPDVVLDRIADHLCFFNDVVVIRNGEIVHTLSSTNVTFDIDDSVYTINYKEFSRYLNRVSVNYGGVKYPLKWDLIGEKPFDSPLALYVDISELLSVIPSREDFDYNPQVIKYLKKRVQNLKKLHQILFDKELEKLLVKPYLFFSKYFTQYELFFSVKSKEEIDVNFRLNKSDYGKDVKPLLLLSIPDCFEYLSKLSDSKNKKYTITVSSTDDYANLKKLKYFSSFLKEFKVEVLLPKKWGKYNVMKNLFSSIFVPPLLEWLNEKGKERRLTEYDEKYIRQQLHSTGISFEQFVEQAEKENRSKFNKYFPHEIEVYEDFFNRFISSFIETETTPLEDILDLYRSFLDKEVKRRKDLRNLKDLPENENEDKKTLHYFRVPERGDKLFLEIKKTSPSYSEIFEFQKNYSGSINFYNFHLLKDEMKPYVFRLLNKKGLISGKSCFHEGKQQIDLNSIQHILYFLNMVNSNLLTQVQKIQEVKNQWNKIIKETEEIKKNQDQHLTLTDEVEKEIKPLRQFAISAFLHVHGYGYLLKRWYSFKEDIQKLDIYLYDTLDRLEGFFLFSMNINEITSFYVLGEMANMFENPAFEYLKINSRFILNDVNPSSEGFQTFYKEMKKSYRIFNLLKQGKVQQAREVLDTEIESETENYSIEEDTENKSEESIKTEIEELLKNSEVN